MRSQLVTGGVAAVLLIVLGLFTYMLLPGLIEMPLAVNLQAGYGLEEKPSVEVSSNFPPELLLGRMDRIEIQIDSFTKEGIRLQDLRIDLKDVDVSVPGLFRGDLEREIRAASLVAEVPEESINEYLRENDLGLEGGEIDVRPDEVVYRSTDVFFGFPASVGLDLRVAGPHIIEVVPQEVTVVGLPLPPLPDGTDRLRGPDLDRRRSTVRGRARSRRTPERRPGNPGRDK